MYKFAFLLTLAFVAASGKNIDRWSMSVDDCFSAEECKDGDVMPCSRYARHCSTYSLMKEVCKKTCGFCDSDLARAFECACDYSGDGGVSASEFKQCFNADYFTTMTFSNYDANRDGKIDHQEATAWSATFTP